MNDVRGMDKEHASQELVEEVLKMFISKCLSGIDDSM